ncbi:MAG: von Willebrand factor type A domain-containing protein [Verrucomicrobiae bacterium]|nr:von Willebrand factor type A domain-containing protein [Verrucomicrobiae bacterium]
MNPDNSSRADLELRITMLLLGELPAAEAEQLRQTIAQDAALKKLHDELKSTIGLVREVEKNPADTTSEDSTPLKLSDERRQKLLAHFQTPRPQESFWIRPMKLPRLIPVLVTIALVAVLAAMLLPALSAAKKKSSRMAALSEERQKTLEIQSQLENRTWSADNNERDSISAPARPPVAAPAAPVDSAPAVVTVAPEPVLAPPPVSIVLPSTETPAQTTATTGSLAESGKDWWNSQNVVSYGIHPSSTGTQPVTLGDRPFLGQVFANGGSQPTSTAGGGGGGGGGGGAAGISGVGGQSAPNGPTLAWDDSSGIRSRLQNKPGAPGEASKSEAAAIPLSGLPIANDFPASAPEEKFPVATGAAAAEQVTSEKKFSTGKEVVRGAAQLRSTEPVSYKHGFYKVTPLPGHSAAVGGAETEAAPTATAEPLLAKSAPIVPPPTEAPVPQAGIPASVEYNFQSGATASGNRAGGAADTKFYRDTLAEEKNVTVAPAPPVMTPPASARVAGEADKSDRMELALNGVNAGTSGTTFASREQATVTLDSLPAGAIKKDADGERYLMITNAGALADDRALSRQAQVRPGKPLVHASLLALTTTPASSEADQQSYETEKRKLKDLEKTHKMLNLKITASSIDSRIPTTSMVPITDEAEPSTKQTFWQSLRGEYASTAKIKVQPDGGIISGFNTSATTSQPYDPYFIQTTFEVMQSSAVLGKVVDGLNLQTAWANKKGGQKLTKSEAIARLKSQLSLQPVRNTKLVAISVTSDKPEEAAQLANAVALAYQNYRVQNNQQTAAKGLEVLRQQYTNEEIEIIQIQSNLDKLAPKAVETVQPVQPVEQPDVPVRQAPTNAPVPQPEILTSENAFSTFSLNVSDVSFKLAEASLEKGQMPDAAAIRSEEFINAFDYRDPEAAAGQPLAFASERARYPFAHNRELLRFSVKTAAMGRPAGRALNLVLLLDNSGSMERADRVAIIREALRVLAGQLQPSDTVSVVTFARTARLWADGVAGDKAGATLSQVGDITPEGGTNLEEAMRLAYETARRHYLANGLNRVVLLTDGAANLGNIDPAVLKQKVEAQRKQGIALDCFGIGFEGYDDDLLEQLSRNGDGRYAFINSPEEAGSEFAAKLAGALQIAASDVKVQVEFNPQRVISYRQIGYAKHQLTKEQFRDNTVDAAEIAAQEAGNALYTVETKPDGTGPVATVRVRYKVPGTMDYQEHSWDVAYEGNVPALAQASPAMRLAGTAGAFSEWLAISPFAQEVTPDDLLKVMSGVPEIYGADERPKKLEWMIRQAKSLSGK